LKQKRPQHNINKYNSEFFSNPLIFELDYEAMKKNNEVMEEELIKDIMKPSRLFNKIANYGDDYLEFMFG